MRRGVGSDGRGKAQWLVVQEEKLVIFVGGKGGGIAFIFRPGCLNRTICPVTTTENMTIKRRTTGFGLKRPGVVWRLHFINRNTTDRKSVV